MASTSTGAGCQEFGQELLGLAADFAPGEEEKYDRASKSAAAAAASGEDVAFSESTPKYKKSLEMDFGGFAGHCYASFTNLPTTYFYRCDGFGLGW